MNRREAMAGANALAPAADDAAIARGGTDPSRFTTRGPAPQASVPIHTTLALAAGIPTPESFAPFGRLLVPAGRRRLPIDTYGDRLDLYREGFETD